MRTERGAVEGAGIMHRGQLGKGHLLSFRLIDGDE